MPTKNHLDSEFVYAHTWEAMKDKGGPRAQQELPVVTCRFPLDLAEALDVLAFEAHKTRSDVLRAMVSRHFKIYPVSPSRLRAFRKVRSRAELKELGL